MRGQVGSRRSLAFRPGNAGYEHLEVRKLPAVDYSLMILPDVNAAEEFDPEDYDLVNLTTYETNLEGFEPVAFGPPGEIAGGTADTWALLAADLENRKNAEITAANNQIANLETKLALLQLSKSAITSNYEEAAEEFDAIDAIDPPARTPSQQARHAELTDELDTLVLAEERTDAKIKSIKDQIGLLNRYKEYLNTTYNYMINNIYAVNMSADPSEPPLYVYQVDTTTLITT